MGRMQHVIARPPANEKKAPVVDDFRGEASSHAAETEESRKLWNKEKGREAERENVEATRILKFL
jgi:hypothetical protein